jgi:ribonuclease Z
VRAPTAGQADRIAAESRAQLLVLTHFSQGYDPGDSPLLAAQAAVALGNEVVLANDLDRIPVPARCVPSGARAFQQC